MSQENISKIYISLRNLLLPKEIVDEVLSYCFYDLIDTNERISKRKVIEKEILQAKYAPVFCKENYCLQKNHLHDCSTFYYFERNKIRIKVTFCKSCGNYNSRRYYEISCKCFDDYDEFEKEFQEGRRMYIHC